MTHGHTNVK